ncbi:hypothetical protein HF846_14545 [Clostridium cadaveris]|uniref:hypothetical protein n=1 Tax=Clostridium cadaveris TaxID=1529 RepID=UPI0014599820|nr:hypothetical protein [Clostridium cadaveris]NME65814.1 hypothetical protein [Clostridium cadaveris]
MQGLMISLVLIIICIQFMAIVDEHKRFEKLERNVAEIINNELKVDRDKRKGIELKNIDLTDITYSEQMGKVAEEDSEFWKAISEGTWNDIVEEIWDTFQARIGLAYMEGVTAKDIMNGYPMHLKKLENRPRVKEME